MQLDFMPDMRNHYRDLFLLLSSNSSVSIIAYFSVNK